MKISELVLNNIKCFENLTFSFINKNTSKPNNVIVIVGENGAGKTTLLKSIASCISTNNSVYVGEQINDKDITKGKDYGHIKVKPFFAEEEKNFIKLYDDNDIEKKVFNLIHYRLHFMQTI
jgi:Predicted ATP-binding protein involved in virulence